MRDIGEFEGRLQSVQFLPKVFGALHTIFSTVVCIVSISE